MIKNSFKTFLAVVAFPLVSIGQVVDHYGVFRQTAFSQNDSSGPTPGVYPNQFLVEVTGTDLGLFSSPQYLLPDASTQTLAVTPNGKIASHLTVLPSDSIDDTTRPLGNYTISLGGTQSSLLLTAEQAPSTPTINAGTWVSNRLQVSDDGYTFSFDPPTGADLVRLYIYQQGGDFLSYRFEGDGSTSSFFVSDDQLESGLNYGATLDFINVVDSTTAYGGAPGIVGYQSRTNFQFTVTDAAASSTWGTYQVVVDGNNLKWVDTNDWMGWILVEQAPNIWVNSLGSWMYLIEPTGDVPGAWAYVYK